MIIDIKKWNVVIIDEVVEDYNDDFTTRETKIFRVVAISPEGKRLVHNHKFNVHESKRASNLRNNIIKRSMICDWHWKESFPVYRSKYYIENEHKFS